jgi:hypothetical protein
MDKAQKPSNSEGATFIKTKWKYQKHEKEEEME